MVLGSAGAVIAGALVFLCILAAVAMFAAFVVARRARRRWRRVREHPLTRGAAALVVPVLAGHRAWSGRGQGRPADLGTLSPGRARSLLWRRVGTVERSVQGAQAVGAATGELSSLCRRLRSAAEDVDRLLVSGAHLERRHPLSGDLRRRLGDLMAVADHIEQAAVASASQTVAPQLDLLLADAEREMQALSSALPSARPSRLA